MQPRPLTASESGKRSGNVLRNRRLFVLEQMVLVAAAHGKKFVNIPRQDWTYIKERLNDMA